MNEIEKAITYFEALLERLGNGDSDNAVCATALASLREQAEHKEKYDACPNPCELVKRLMDEQAERGEGCEWCRNMGEYDRFEYNRIDADGHSEVHAHVVVSNLARYCPNCGKRLKVKQDG